MRLLFCRVVLLCSPERSPGPCGALGVGLPGWHNVRASIMMPMCSCCLCVYALHSCVHPVFRCASLAGPRRGCWRKRLQDAPGTVMNCFHACARSCAQTAYNVSCFAVGCQREDVLYMMMRALHSARKGESIPQSLDLLNVASIDVGKQICQIKRSVDKTVRRLMVTQWQ